MALHVTQNFGDLATLRVGKLNFVEFPRATPLRGGGGVDTFWNVALATPISGVLPPTTYGAMLNINTQPVSFVFMVFDLSVTAQARLKNPGWRFCRMAKLVFGMNLSLDGYVDHQAFGPDRVLFRHFIEQARGLTGSVYGRRLYEVMRYWDEDDPEWTPDMRDFAVAWRSQRKWVVSRTLKSVGPNATLVGDDMEAVIRGLKDELAGEIEVGGPELAQSLTGLGLIDEYWLYFHPVVLGRGKPFFAGPRPRLRLVASDLIGEDAIRLTYVPA